MLSITAPGLLSLVTGSLHLRAPFIIVATPPLAATKLSSVSVSISVPAGKPWLIEYHVRCVSSVPAAQDTKRADELWPKQKGMLEFFS